MIFMASDKETLKKKYEHTADTYEKKGKREWAYAKNDKGGEHFAKARDAFDRAKKIREKAKNIETEKNQ